MSDFPSKKLLKFWFDGVEHHARLSFKAASMIADAYNHTLEENFTRDLKSKFIMMAQQFRYTKEVERLPFGEFQIAENGVFESRIHKELVETFLIKPEDEKEFAQALFDEIVENGLTNKEKSYDCAILLKGTWGKMVVKEDADRKWQLYYYLDKPWFAKPSKDFVKATIVE